MKSFSLKKLVAEFFGTAMLVLFGCGVAVVSGFAGGSAFIITVALAFGLILVAMAYAIGPVSGCHINPAVTLGLAINKRISWMEAVGYWIAQFLGAIAGAALLFAIQKTAGIDKVTGMGQNFFGNQGGIGHGLSIGGAFLVEIILTFVFVTVILMVTHKSKGGGKKAGLIIGLTLTLVHLLGIGLTGTSVNPARSLGPAIFVTGEAIKQVWVFILAPLVGAALAAFFAKYVLGSEEETGLEREASVTKMD